MDTCKVCGCDDLHACEGGCWWVRPGMCSACEFPATPELLEKLEPTSEDQAAGDDFITWTHSETGEVFYALDRDGMFVVAPLGTSCIATLRRVKP